MVGEVGSEHLGWESGWWEGRGRGGRGGRSDTRCLGSVGAHELEDLEEVVHAYWLLWVPRCKHAELVLLRIIEELDPSPGFERGDQAGEVLEGGGAGAVR